MARPRKEQSERPTDLTEIKTLIQQEVAASQAPIMEMLKSLVEKSNAPPTIPIAQTTDARIAAMKEALGDETVSRHRSVDLRHPGADKSGFQPDDVVKVAESSQKFAAYHLDKDGFPVQPVFEYACQACPTREVYVKGPNKKVCPKCGNTMIKEPSGRYEAGTPAFGVIKNFMYKARKGGRKYKVQFEKFGIDGLHEDELVLCQR